MTCKVPETTEHFLFIVASTRTKGGIFVNRKEFPCSVVDLGTLSKNIASISEEGRLEIVWQRTSVLSSKTFL